MKRISRKERRRVARGGQPVAVGVELQFREGAFKRPEATVDIPDDEVPPPRVSGKGANVSGAHHGVSAPSFRAPDAELAGPGLVDGAPRDTHVAGDLLRRLTPGQALPDGFQVDSGRAAAVDAALPCRGDPLGLPFAAQVGLELREHAQHVEESLAGRGRGVDRLLGGREMGALVLECRGDDLEVPERTRQAVDARDHQRLAGMDEGKNRLQLGTSREGGAVAGLGAHHRAAGGLQRRELDIGVLVRGRDPGVADPGGRAVHFACAHRGISTLNLYPPEMNTQTGLSGVQAPCHSGYTHLGSLPILNCFIPRGFGVSVSLLSIWPAIL